MTTKLLTAGVFACLFAFAQRAKAVQQTLPTPEPYAYVDTESSVNVPLPMWPDLGRRVTIDLTAYATPSNAIQIAFGQDTNGDEDLEPEETWFVIGVDCGVPFARQEGRGRTPGAPQSPQNATPLVVDYGGVIDTAGQPSGEATSSSLQQEEGDHHCPPPPTFSTFSIKQPQPITNRFDFAKVTTRGREDTAAQIAAEIRKPGQVLFLR